MDNLIDRKYTKITFNQANDNLKKIMVAKGGQTADVSTASYGSVIREMLAAHTDVNAFWVESAYNNSWLETASTPVAGYIGARSLGYSVRRPIPARAGFIAQLKRSGQYSTVKIIVPKGTTFSVSGNTITAIDDVELVYDRNTDTNNTGLMTIVSGRAILCEGSFNTVSFFSNASQFQEFQILDSGFSNWFGDGDPNFIDDHEMVDRINLFTTVTTDSGLTDNIKPVAGYEDKIYWRISRRGLEDPSLSKTVNDLTTYSDDGNQTLNYTCSVVTANDGLVRIEFGDGVKSAIPYGMIVVKYFSTKGVSGNLVNVAGTKITPSSNNIIISQKNGKESDLTLSDITFSLSTDITGGVDIESLESIKINAPSVFNSFDALGNKVTYARYLGRQSDIKYAIAFGEDILSRYSKGVPDIKYANIVRFSLIKDLYRERDGKYFITDPYEYYVNGFKVNGLMQIWDYDYSQLPNSTYIDEQDKAILYLREKMQYNNVKVYENGDEISISEFVQNYLPKISTSFVPINRFNIGLKPLDMIETGSELYLLMQSLNRKGYLTLGNGQHAYVPPIVHDMDINIDLILRDGANFTDIKTVITNKIYQYLTENTRFATPIYASALKSIIQQLPETAGVNLTFSAIGNGYEDLELDKLTWLSESTKKFVNQSSLDISDPDTFEVLFSFDAKYQKTSGEFSIATPTVVSINISSQEIIRSQIRSYYTQKIAYLSSDGIYKVRANITEKDLNDFVSYVWSIAINEVYASLYSLYKSHGDRGEIKEKISIYHLIESLKTWSFVDGKLSFIDNNYIQNVTENGTLFSYMVYIIEYIKLIRNIINPKVAQQLIDSDGNISKYTSSNEIVQCRVSQSNFTLRIGSEGIKE